MSQHTFQTTLDVQVTLGYDRPLDYVFCTITSPCGEILYSNLSDEEAGTACRDVEYFREKLAKFGISVPESMFAEVGNDQRNRVGHRTVEHTWAS